MLRTRFCTGCGQEFPRTPHNRTGLCGPACPGKDDGRPVIVCNMGAHGLGDGLQGLVAVCGLKKDHPDCRLVYKVGGSAVGFVSLFEGPDIVATGTWDHNGSRTLVGEDRQLNNNYTLELKSKAKVPRWERYRENIGASAIVLPELKNREKITQMGAAYAGVVLLCPFSTAQDREYSVPSLLALEGALLRAGYRVVVTHHEPKRVQPFKAEKVVRPRPDQMAALMLNASIVVGVDSGLTHLAGLLGVDALVLTGPTDGDKIFGVYPTVKNISGTLPCNGCYWTGPVWAGEHCRPHCPSIQGISAERLLTEVDDVNIRKITGGRSLLTHDRLVVIRNSVRDVIDLPGDLAEVGVYRGGSAKLIGHTDPAAKLSLFDTFQGIPEDDVYKPGHKAGDFKADFDKVKEFINNPNAVYYVGRFPDTAPAHGLYKFVHVDCDIGQTVVACLDYFCQRMTPGGIMVFDDYGSSVCLGVEKAITQRGLHAEQSAPNQARIRF